ncbi:MAG: dihydroorotase family protein [Candidatus Methanomethylicia archaeon]
MTVIDSIISGKVFLNGKLIDSSIAIDNGKIVGLGSEENLPKAERYYRFHDKIILPGLIDAHVHLRDQELSYKETFESGTMASAAGGFTTVLDMPNNSPSTDSPLRFKDRLASARGRIFVNVGFYSLFPMNIGEVEEIIGLGAVGFKVYLNRRVGFLDPCDYDVIKDYLKICGSRNFPVVFHAEDYSTISSLEEKFRELKSFKGFLEAHCIDAEIRSISRVLDLARASNCKVHLAHVSSGLSFDLISKFRDLVTCEVTPHHLLLTSNMLRFLGGFGKMEPPLRSIFDAVSLWFRIHGGFVDVIADDHAPHSIEEKVQEDFWDVRSGVPGLETTLPLMLTAVNYGFLSLNDIVYLMSYNPSRIFHLKGKGCIDVGFDADLTIIDLSSDWIVDPSKFYSKAKFSPFNSFRVKGKVYSTFVNGVMVYHDGEILDKGGEIIFGGGLRC